MYNLVNIENASYPVGICAERSALASAISSGERVITTIAIVTDLKELGFPCGLCRQAISEFGLNIKVC